MRDTVRNPRRGCEPDAKGNAPETSGAFPASKPDPQPPLTLQDVPLVLQLRFGRGQVGTSPYARGAVKATRDSLKTVLRNRVDVEEAATKT
jgi:hypothetical protein